MPNADDCIFCQIIAGRAPGSVVYRDDVCVAFMDIQPVNAGHLLVVPLAHAADLAALDPETGAQLMRVAQRLTAAQVARRFSATVVERRLVWTCNCLLYRILVRLW